MGKIKDNKYRKSAWFYVAIIVGIILLFTLINEMINPTKTNQNYVGNNNLVKGTYSYTYSGNGENSYIHRPNDVVSIVISGNYNKLTVSAETEVSKITLSGSYNQIILCKGQYPTPEFVKSGINNQINSSNC